MDNKAKSRQQEQELVRKSQQGDEEAFSELVVKYQRRVYSLVYGMLRNSEDALDVTQEAFFKAYRSLQGFRGGGGFYTWLYRIAYNLSIDFMRKEWRKTHLEYDDTRQQSEESNFSAIQSSAFHPGKEAARKELSRVIMDGIQALPEQHRAVILLREIEGLTYEEIAKTLKVRKGTVMSRLHYARQKLQEVLTPYIKDGEVGEKK